VGYWISLVHPQPGLTALQTIEWQNAQFDLDAVDVNALPPEVRLTDDQRARWERICDRVIELVGEADREEFPSHVDIASRDPYLRLEYAGDSASISIPYWYGGEKAVSAVATAYAIGRIVEGETSLVGVDSQTAAGLALEHVDDAIQLYTGTRASARSAIEKDT